MSIKVVVLGCKGMLGWTLVEYIKLYHPSIVVVAVGGRDQLDASSPDVQQRLEELSETWSNDGGVVYVINCIGVIPQKHDETKEAHLFIRVNSVFPHILFNVCLSRGYRMIHITTDCVYDGLKGSSYEENERHTESRLYGASKSCGENSSCMMIRTSIIGEEREGGKSLLEWVRSQRGQRIRGYLNHQWNGVTCVELSRVMIEEVIKNGITWRGVRHVVTKHAVSKWEMVSCINDEYQLQCVVDTWETQQAIDKTLKPSNDPVVASWVTSSIPQQIRDAKQFYEKLKKE